MAGCCEDGDELSGPMEGEKSLSSQATIIIIIIISWLRYYATSWKVAGSIPDEVT
jgi:hypothetical protein